MPLRTFEYRLFLNKHQSDLLMKCLEETRIISDEMLEFARARFKETGAFPGKYDLEAAFLGQGAHVPAITLRILAARLAKSLKRYLAAGQHNIPGTGFPQLLKQNRWDSIQLGQYGKDVCLHEDMQHLIVPWKIGHSLKIRLHRPLEGTPQTVHLVYRADGYWYALIACEIQPQVEQLPSMSEHPATGTGVAVNSFSTESHVPTVNYVRLSSTLQKTPMRKHGLNHRFIFVSALVLLLLIAGSSALSYSNLVATRRPLNVLARPIASKAQAIGGGNRWTGDKQTTAPTFSFSPPSAQQVSVSPLFAAYYTSNSRAQILGTPVTVAFPTDLGWIQFFESGALLLPAIQYKHTPDASDPQIVDPMTELVKNGARDPNTGIIRLPLFQALLTVGSQAPVGGDGSPLTYVDLRKATDPDLMVSTSISASNAVLSAQVFIKEDVHDGNDVGHLMPMPFWNYINRSDISPDGWETDFGPPLTETLPFTITRNGHTHQMLVQAFWDDGLVLDEDTLDASGQPLVQQLKSGVDYLRTLGPPAAAVSAQQPVWAQSEIGLLDAPGTGQAVAHVGQNFPLTLLGDTAWDTDMLWYHVQWTAGSRIGTGWVEASAITFTSPGNAPVWSSFDILSPDLAAYLAGLGSSVGVVVYDVTRQRYYTYNADGQFITGSSIKVPIMLTLLNFTESQGREPNGSEMGLLTTMIENSNNDSAAALYYGETGGAAGVTGYLQGVGINGLNADPDAFGWSLITPLTMVNLLTLLHEGKILTATDRNLALNLMENIESDQQVGVGDTAPSGATVAMKDGWVPAPDGLWAMNSSGIVTLGPETYIISVYSQESASLGDGQAIVQHVCGAVASLLT